MFGNKNRMKNGDGETVGQRSAAGLQTEIPQQIYNTLESSSRRKRQLAIMAVLGLGLLILLTLGGIRLFSALTDNDDKPAISSSDNKVSDGSGQGAKPSKPQSNQDKQAVSQSQQTPQAGNDTVPKTSGQPTNFAGNDAQNNGFVTSPR